MESSQVENKKIDSEYKTGKIYIIKNKINDLTYIGCTIYTLKDALKNHRCSMNDVNVKDTYKIYQAMNEFDRYNCFIELLENYECKSNAELVKRKGELIREYKPTLNIVIPGRKNKEWRIANKKEIIDFRGAIRKQENEIYDISMNKARYRKIVAEERYNWVKNKSITNPDIGIG